MTSWAEMLAAWAIPDQILAAAPESPWGFPVALFAPPAEPADTPSRRRALEALPHGGSVLDVGCGGGAASLALVPPASRITGVDSSERMLATFAESAEARGVAHMEVLGTWPEAAPAVEPADVVVCHHVVYNVPDLAEFIRALTDRARVRVVCELTDNHPQSSLNDLWRHFWKLERPTRPTADDAVTVIRDVGIEPTVERWSRPPRWAAAASRPDEVAFARRRLCLPPERDAELDRLLPAGGGTPQEVVTVWWDI